MCIRDSINTEGEDHIYDELRYVCMKNPIAPRRNKPPALVVYCLLYTSYTIEKHSKSKA